MATTLEKWENIIKEKRKNTPFRDFVKEITSWQPLSFYNINWKISRYPDTLRVKIIDDRDFIDRSIDEIQVGWDIDTADFMWSLQELWLEHGLPRLWHFWETENSAFSETVGAVKNAYLSFMCFYAENVLYSFCVTWNTKDVFNSVLVVNNSEIVYFSTWVIKSFKIFYSRCIIDSNNVWFSVNLMWCSECIFCDNLENKSYCIWNVQYSKEEYLHKKTEILDRKEKFLSYMEKISSIPWMNISSSNLSDSTFTLFSENLQNSHYSYQIKDWRNAILAWNFSWAEWVSEKMYDNFTTAINAFDIYWWLWTSPWDNGYCNMNSWEFSHLYYSRFMMSCSFCLWCVWLKNKSYCILNKQYSKEEWYILVDKIFEQMNKDWILWNFFPWKLNPFYFNDTAAYLIDDSFTKEEVTKESYMWRDEEIKVDIPEWSEIVDIKDLDIVNYGEEILKKVIRDKSWNYYRIVKMEYDFLKKYNLPLPEVHWLDRIKLGFKFN